MSESLLIIDLKFKIICIKNKTRLTIIRSPVINPYAELKTLCAVDIII